MKRSTSQAVFAISAAIVFALAASANATTVSFLGSDETTGTAWRSTSVVKPSFAFDPNADKAYGNDGYYVTITGTGQDRPVTMALPAYIASVTDKYIGGGGGRYIANQYPDFDNPTLAIGPAVANVNAGIFYANETGPVTIMDFTLAQDADFVLTIPLVGNDYRHRPTALSVTQTAGGVATAAAVVPTPASGDAVNYLFFEVDGSAGDAFDVVINGPDTIHGTGGVAFESIGPAPSYPDLVNALNPHGYWRLGEAGGTTAFNEVGFPGGENGTYQGNATPGVAGIPGGGGDTAASFDGAGDRVRILDPHDPTNYTLEAWVKLDALPTSWANVVMRTNTDSYAPNAFSHILQVNSAGMFRHYSWDGSGRHVDSTILAQPDQWYHVVGKYHPGGSGNGFVSISVNGTDEKKVSGSFGNPWTGGDRWMLGDSHQSLPDFHGTIDEVAIYHHLLTSQHIMAHYEAGITAPTVIPEPISMLAVGLSIAGLGGYMRRRRA